MYALVRFVAEKTDKRYVIPVADITNFKPKHDLDFDNTVPYDAYWSDEDDKENSGVYAVQVLKLAGQKRTDTPLTPSTEQLPQEATIMNDGESAAQAVHEEAPNSDRQPDGNFMATPDGRFHLSSGIYISANQAEKLFKNKKPSILIKDAAQVVWGDELTKRSVSGRLAPTKNGTNEQPSKQLTPAKLNVIYA
ncbi:hypothetical protein HPB52_021474 [Rhipicephalus sanguineus]|uniref:Uncharacterized protein n=1 Tax=Rhipicephalus sanguineus TaxID=34632 RepID=A0A9D4QFF3_RHISA|nr:hypothetical protein HPB52_021474 [Rhipicephalus sanguineus]